MLSLFRNRWFCAFLLLLAADAAVAAIWAGRSKRRPPTEVLRVLPEVLHLPKEAVTVTFSRPMVEASETLLVRDVPEVKVSPPAPLLGLWRSRSTLELRASPHFSLATEYELRLASGLLDAEGRALGGKLSHRFRTEELRLLRAHQASLSRSWALTVSVAFNDEVPLGELDRKIHFRDETGAEVPMSRETRTETAKVVSYLSDEKRREWVEVSLEEGLRGVSGPLGLASTTRSRIQVDSGLKVLEVRAGASEAKDAWIVIDFNLRVDPKVVRDYLRVEPAARFEMEGLDGPSLRLRGDFLPGSLYRLHVRSGLPVEGGRFLADDVVESVRFPELPPRIDFLGEGSFINKGGSLTLLVRSVNVKGLLLDLNRIYPNNIAHYLDSSSCGRRLGSELIERKQISVPAAPNRPAITRIDLRELLPKDTLGPLEIVLRMAGDRWESASKIVTITDLGIHVKASPRGLLVWVIHLSDLSPADGAAVTVLTKTNQELFTGTTDSQGLVRFDGESGAAEGNPFVVTAAIEGDFSYLPLETTGISREALEVEGRPYPVGACEAFVYPERGVIRPGETIHLRALAREAGGGLPPAGMPLSWELARPDRRIAASIPATLSDLGTAEVEWASQPYLPTGPYTASLKVPGEGGMVLGETTFRIEEFLPETLRVGLSAEERRFGGGTPIKVTVKAEHLFGGSAKGLLAEARCDLQPEPFTRTEWPGVVFTSSTGEFTGPTLKAEQEELDEKGEAEFTFEIPRGLKAQSALQAAITASVIQVSGRASTVRILRDVDPLPFYLGLSREEGHARIGEEWRTQVIALRPDGSLQDLPLAKARLARITWSHSLEKDPKSGHYRWLSERLEKEMLARDVPCPGGRGSFAFTPEVGGEYLLRVVAGGASDETPVETSLTFYAEGGERDEGSLEIPSRIALTPDRPYYRAGDIARVRVQSPITGFALFATETDRVHETRTFSLTETQTVLDVPVTEDLAPHGYVTLTVVRSSMAPGSRGVPVRAYGAAALLRDPAERAEGIEMSLPAEARPGGDITLDLSVLGAGGEPEEAEVAVALVDAGILALTSFKAPDPLEFFAGRRELGTRAADVYSLIVPEPFDLVAKAPSVPGGDGGASGLLNPIASKRVKSVSLWLGGLRTDAAGRISKTIALPDFDGELVAMAVASGRTGVASVRREIKVRRPIILEPGLPRFLAPGDRFLAPVTLHNTTSGEVAASVAVTTSENLKLAPEEQAERMIPVPPRGSSTSWFSLSAGAAGPAEVSFTCRALGEVTKNTTELPVRPASPPVTEGGYLALDPGKSADLQAKADFLEGTLSSELVLSTTMLPALEGSLQYLLHYPYGCVEQTSSSLIPWITLRDYLKAIDSVAYTDAEIQDRIEAGILRLFSMQTSDGGLGFWPGETHSYPFGSLHAAFVLGEAKAAGYALPERRFQELLDYIEGLLARPGGDDPWNASTLRAQALEILARQGRPRPAWIQTLYERRTELSEESRARLAVAAWLSKCQLPGPLLGPEAEEKDPAPRAGALKKERERDLGGILYSRPREMCVVLSALVDLGEPREKILPLLADLRGQSEGGRYRSTQEDGLYVFTMGKVAKLFPAPAGVVRATLLVPGQPPRSLEVKDRMVVPLGAGTSPARLSVEEGGTLFAFFRTRGVPREKAAVEGDQGIAVRRAFLTPEGKPRPSGPFKQGESVVVEIRFEAGRSLQNVAVVDALPAGFEIENPNLVTSDGRVKVDPAFGITHSDIRDDRLILFANPAGGKRSYSYVARAVTAGRFALPPICAECMYDSGLRSLGGSGEVEVIR